MVEYIRRDLVMGKAADVPRYFCKMISAYDVMEIPTEDVEPVRHGKWYKVSGVKNKWACSVCGERRNVATQFGWNYCPNCGAKMDLGG